MTLHETMVQVLDCLPLNERASWVDQIRYVQALEEIRPLMREVAESMPRDRRVQACHADAEACWARIVATVGKRLHRLAS